MHEGAEEHAQWRERRRLQLNEKLFEALNQRLEDQVTDMRRTGAIDDDLDAPIHYMCECSAPDCRERFDMPPREYARLHRRPHDCVVLRGHEIPDIEVVVDVIGDLLRVRKRDL